MSAQVEPTIRSYVAAGAITKYHGVAMTVANLGLVSQSVTEDTTAEQFVGVAQNDAAIGERVDVIILGESFAIAGAATGIPNTSLMVNAAGRFITHVAAAAPAGAAVAGHILSNENYVGAGADGDRIRMFVNPRNATAAT